MREEELKYALALTRLRGVSQNAALKLYDRAWNTIRTAQ